VYSPGELLRVLEKQVEARLGAYNITGLELEGVLGEIGENRGYTRIYGVHLADAAGGASFELSLPRRLAEKARGLEHARVRVRGDLGTNCGGAGSLSGWTCARWSQQTPVTSKAKASRKPTGPSLRCSGGTGGSVCRSRHREREARLTVAPIAV